MAALHRQRAVPKGEVVPFGRRDILSARAPGSQGGWMCPARSDSAETGQGQACFSPQGPAPSLAGPSTVPRAHPAFTGGAGSLRERRLQKAQELRPETEGSQRRLK